MLHHILDLHIWYDGITDLVAYGDSDWGGNYRLTVQVCNQIVVFLGYNPVSWCSKKQAAVSRSSTEAEYRALANTAAEIGWLQEVLCDLHVYIY